MLNLAGGLALGLVMGMRHAVEPDHLAAVTTLVARQRHPLAGAIVGMCWGMGHTLSLLAVGLILALAQTAMPESLARNLELAVAVMLIILGLRSVWQAVGLGRDESVQALHRQGTDHDHDAPDGHVHLGPWTVARQPLIVGLMHGLAGSGALSALAIANMPSVPAQLAYMFVFGVGSIIGMGCLTGLAGLPLARVQPGRRAGQVLCALSGAVSLVVGIWWGLPLAFGA